MHANVEDRGIKGDITPLMAAASGGYVDIVKLLLVHGADVNAQSSTGARPYPVSCGDGRVRLVPLACRSLPSCRPPSFQATRRSRTHVPEGSSTW